MNAQPLAGVSSWPLGVMSKRAIGGKRIAYTYIAAQKRPRPNDDDYGEIHKRQKTAIEQEIEEAEEYELRKETEQRRTKAARVSRELKLLHNTAQVYNSSSCCP